MNVQLILLFHFIFIRSYKRYLLGSCKTTDGMLGTGDMTQSLTLKCCRLVKKRGIETKSVKNGSHVL